MFLFNGQISNWREWGGIFQSIAAFGPLVEHILAIEKLPAAKLENLSPGTNAVFKAGDYVVKVFAPCESGIDQTPDLQTELFAAARADELGISAPAMVAHGLIEDKYKFAYIITEYIAGAEFKDAVKVMGVADRLAIGCKLRAVTDKMNKPCGPFNSIDVINDADDARRFRRWDERYNESFRAERLAYIRSHNYGEKVFVHGDLCGDNILLAPDGELYIIDFADAVLAPIEYEHALIAVALFELDAALIEGYFGNCSADELASVCFNGLLIHDFGGDIVAQLIGDPGEVLSLCDLQNKLKAMITKHRFVNKVT